MEDAKQLAAAVLGVDVGKIERAAFDAEKCLCVHYSGTFKRIRPERLTVYRARMVVEEPLTVALLNPEWLADDNEIDDRLPPTAKRNRGGGGKRGGGDGGGKAA